MKKFIMIIAAAGFVNFVSAKPNDQKDFGSSGKRYEKHEEEKIRYDAPKYSLNERNEKIRQNDWYFEQKIREVKNSRRLSASQKYRQVYSLQKQREAEERSIENYYARNNNGHYNNHQSKW
jgi:hypothetical protein